MYTIETEVYTIDRERGVYYRDRERDEGTNEEGASFTSFASSRVL